MSRLYQNNKSYRFILKSAAFFIYLALLCYGLFFAESMGRVVPREDYTYNLVPFLEIRRYMRNVETIGVYRVCINLIGNVAAFLPFGFILPGLWPDGEKKHPLTMFFVAASFSASVEILQLVTRVGSCDVDDVILNTCGAMIGYLFYQVIRQMRIYNKRSNREET